MKQQDMVDDVHSRVPFYQYSFSKARKGHYTRDRTTRGGSYLLELRTGYADWRLKSNIGQVRKQFHLSRESPAVPHISLYGAFTIRKGYHVRDVQNRIARVAKKFDTLPFLINGWDTRTSGRGSVIAHKIKPSGQLEQFRSEVVHELLKVTIPGNVFDHDKEPFWYHSTLACQLGVHEFESISDYLGIGQRKSIFSTLLRFLMPPVSPCGTRGHIRPVYLPVDALRVTLLHNSLIAGE